MTSILIIFIGSFVCYRMAFSVPKRSLSKVDSYIPHKVQYDRHRKRILEMIDKVAALPYEDVWTTSFDGLKLHGKYYHVKDGAPVHILFHGYQSIPELDFCGGLPFSLDNGNNALLIDQRAHGKSEGKCLSFGINERYDCISWIRFVNERFGRDTEIVLYGISMGASTVLMASDLIETDNVKAIIADCGYTSPDAIIRKVIDDRKYPKHLTRFLIRTGARLYGGFRLLSASAPETLSRCKVPVLFIHGLEDRYVPCGMSMVNYRRCSAENKKLLTVADAGHGLSYMEDTDLYERAVKAFLDQIRQV